MPLSPPGAAPLRVQAAAAASLLAEGVLPEDVGTAAGLANPAGGEYTPGVLADLADAIRRAAVSAAGALDRDGASNATADAAWAEGDETVDYLDSENAPWWDPEALAALLCATRVADGARGALRASDQAVMARRLADEHGWSPRDVGDLVWCIHTAQHTDTSASRGHAALSRGHVVTMARVEELADLALDLSGDGEADAAAAPQSDDHPHWWSRAEASALFPRALPATDWDVGNGLSGLSAVEGCALLAAALAAGGTAGRSDDGDGDGGFGRGGDSDGFSAAHDESASAEYPRLTDDRDDRDSRRKAMGWPVSDIAAALRTVLDEPAEDGVGGWDEAREADGPPSDAATATASSRLARLAFSNASSSSSSSSSDASDTDASARVRRARANRRHANSNVVGTANAFSRRGVAGRGGGGVARAPGPLGGPRPPRGGGALRAGAGTRAAQRGSPRRFTARTGGTSRHACGRPRTCSGGKARAPRLRRRRRRRRRAPDVGWNAERAAVLVAALAEGAANEGSSSAFDGESQDGAWDVPGFIAPMADALVGEHDWSPLETAALLEHLQAWTAEDAAALALGLSNWADAGVAALLGALMEWRRRDRAEVAHVVRALISRPPGSGGEWQGGGALGKLLGVREGEARAAAAAAKGEAAKGDGADGEAALFAKSAAGLTISSRGRVRRDRGAGRGRGDALLPHAFPSEPIQFGREREAGAETIGDGYSADAD